MKDYVFTFRTAVRKVKKEEIEDKSEFVNNFMWENQILSLLLLGTIEEKSVPVVLHLYKPSN